MRCIVSGVLQRRGLVAVVIPDLVARDLDGLAAIERRLHDSWLEVPGDTVRAPLGTVELVGVLEHGHEHVTRSIGPIHQVEVEQLRLRLVVAQVERMEIDDSAGIGALNLSQLAFDGPTRTLRILGSIPVSITLTVASLDVRVGFAATGGRTRTRWRLGFTSR